MIACARHRRAQPKTVAISKAIRVIATPNISRGQPIKKQPSLKMGRVSVCGAETRALGLAATSAWGQKRHFGSVLTTSGLPPTPDMPLHPWHLERSGVIGLVGVAPEPLRKHSENENRSGSSEGSVDGDKVVETGVIPCWADKRRKTAARERRRGFGATFYEASRPR